MPTQRAGPRQLNMAFAALLFNTYPGLVLPAAGDAAARRDELVAQLAAEEGGEEDGGGRSRGPARHRGALGGGERGDEVRR